MTIEIKELEKAPRVSFDPKHGRDIVPVRVRPIVRFF